MVLKENIEKILSKKIKEKVPSHPNIQTKFIVICTDNQNNILKTSLVKERKEICKILLLYNLRRLFIFITKKKMNLLKYCLNKIESKNLLIKNITTNNIPKIINNYNRDNSNIYFIVESTTNISEKVKISMTAVRGILVKLKLKVNRIHKCIAKKNLELYILKKTIKIGESFFISFDNYFYMIRNNKQLKRSYSQIAMFL